MIEPVFVQQVTLLSTILLGFSFPVVAQLATFNHGEKADSKPDLSQQSKATRKLNEVMSASSGRVVSWALVVAIISAATMLVATFIGVMLTMVTTHYDGRPDPIPPDAIQISNELLNMWRWPFLAGIIAFLGTFALMGWIRSKVVGVLTTAASIGAAVVMYIVWDLVSQI
jgi:hypothetical protein